MMTENQFNHNYMDFVARVGEKVDMAYASLNKQFHNKNWYARYDALIDSMFDIVDMAYNDGSDYFMQQSIDHGKYMYNVYKDTDNVNDATYYTYYYHHMQMFHSMYLQCMTY